MSGPNSLGYLLRIATTSFDDDAPVSSYRGFAVENNLQHLIDMSPQHRINWAGGEDTLQWLYSANDGITHYASYPFLHTWINEAFPCGLDIRICGKTDAGGTMSLDARVAPYSGSAFDANVEEYWSDSGTTSSASSVEIISSIYYPATAAQRNAMWKSWQIEQDSKTRSVKAALARLDVRWIVADSVDSTSVSGLTAVSVREFC